MQTDKYNSLEYSLHNLNNQNDQQQRIDLYLNNLNNIRLRGRSHSQEYSLDSKGIEHESKKETLLDLSTECSMLVWDNLHN